MGQWLADAFGGAGLHLSKLELTEADKKQDEQRALHASLSQLT
jgi:hypothetical protein